MNTAGHLKPEDRTGSAAFGCSSGFRAIKLSLGGRTGPLTVIPRDDRQIRRPRSQRAAAADRNRDRTEVEGRPEELAAALVKLAADDTSLQVATDPQSGRIILKGMDESHLDACIDWLRRACGVDINVGAPQVAFRGRPTRRAEVEYVHKKQSGRSGQFAAVKIAVEPNKPGAGYVFESMIIGSVVPEEYIPGVERGLASVLASGVVAASPVIDVKVVLLDGKYHDVDSSARALKSHRALPSARRCRRPDRCCSSRS
jgi:Elongation factor G, domain IV/Elongation Factor G, domain III